MAMVFSVQQGEHGPLVVYKLEVPRSSHSIAPVAPAAQPAALSGQQFRQSGTAPARRAVPLDAALQRATPQRAKAPRLSPLEPAILGTVVMPAKQVAAPQPSAAVPAPISLLPAEETAAPVELDPYAFGALYRGAPQTSEEGNVLINNRTGEELTLDDVSSDLAWRRETAERLRQLPVGPRF